MKKFKLAATSLTLTSLMLLSGCGGGKKKALCSGLVSVAQLIRFLNRC